jgi:UDP-glucuronate 4-epimerase
VFFPLEECRVAGNSKRVLLTGGAGFIGSHVAEALLRRGASLGVVENLDDFYPPAWKKANLESIRAVAPFGFFEQDICSPDRMREIFDGFRPDTIIHLAARAGVRPSIDQPRLYEHVNVAGTVNLLELCKEFQVSRFIFGSSSSVYGESDRAPFSEAQYDLRPISPYAATKLAGESFCHTYAHLYQLPVIALRFFTVYGPRQRPDLAIHKFVARIEAGKPIPIFGDGETGRDYTFVEDIVAGILGAFEFNFSSTAGAPMEICNLGNSHPVKLSLLVHMLENATGKKAAIQRESAQQGDVPLTWANIAKAGKLLSYQPQTTLEEGLKKFVAWYRATDPTRRA